jgi:hypothetical protein
VRVAWGVASGRAKRAGFDSDNAVAWKRAWETEKRRNREHSRRVGRGVQRRERASARRGDECEQTADLAHGG